MHRRQTLLQISSELSELIKFCYPWHRQKTSGWVSAKANPHLQDPKMTEAVAGGKKQWPEVFYKNCCF